MEVARPPGDRDLSGIYPSSDLGGLELNDRNGRVDVDPGLGRISRRGGLVAQSRGRASDEAQTVRPLSAQVDLDRRDAVHVASAADPGPATVLSDPKLDG